MKRRIGALLAAMAVFSQVAVAQETCGFSFFTPRHQTINVDNDYAMVMTGYTDNSRRWQLRRSGRADIDAYGGRTFVLVKGGPPAGIDVTSLSAPFLKLISVFALSGMSTCFPPERYPVYVVPEEGQHTGGSGTMTMLSPGEIRYDVELTDDALWPGRAKVRYHGEISLAAPEPPPADDADFSGYAVLKFDREAFTMQLIGAAGSGGIPATLGAIRQYVATH